MGDINLPVPGARAKSLGMYLNFGPDRRWFCRQLQISPGQFDPLPWIEQALHLKMTSKSNWQAARGEPGSSPFTRHLAHD